MSTTNYVTFTSDTNADTYLTNGQTDIISSYSADEYDGSTSAGTSISQSCGSTFYYGNNNSSQTLLSMGNTFTLNSYSASSTVFSISSYIVNIYQNKTTYINAVYQYNPNSNIVLSGIKISYSNSGTVKYPSDVTATVSGNVYTFTQGSNTTTISYSNATNTLTYTGNMNNYALLTFGYIAILTGLIKNTSSTSIPGCICQSVAWNLGF